MVVERMLFNRSAIGLEQKKVAPRREEEEEELK